MLFTLSGEIDGDAAVQLAELVTREAGGRVRLDLADVTLATRAAVRFLARAESTRIRLVNCPDYVRSWIDAERGDSGGGGDEG